MQVPHPRVIDSQPGAEDQNQLLQCVRYDEHKIGESRQQLLRGNGVAA